MSVIAPDEGWIRTLSGGRFYPFEPRLEDYNIHDIAHSLATKNRYGGHCRGFYSVAQHSVHVSEHCPSHPLPGLLHDIDEAYSPFGDIPRPVKRKLAHGVKRWIRQMSDAIQRMGFIAFGLDPDMPEEVHRADDAILWDEQRALMNGSLTLMPKSEIGLGIEIEPWTWEQAELRFLKRFVDLGGKI